MTRQMQEAYVLAAKRTPVGKAPRGAYRTTRPDTLLAHALTSIVTREGKVLVRELLPESIPDSVRAALADCAPEPAEGEPEIDTWWGEPGLTSAEKVYAWNTFEILAFRTGNPDNPVNAIPGRATATCQIRFVAGCKPESCIPIIRRHLDAHGFSYGEIARLTPDGEGGTPEQQRGRVKNRLQHRRRER